MTILNLDKNQIRYTKKDDEVLFSIYDAYRIAGNTNHPHTYWPRLEKELKEQKIDLQITKVKIKTSNGKNRKTKVISLDNLKKLLNYINTYESIFFQSWLNEKFTDKNVNIINQIFEDNKLQYYTIESEVRIDTEAAATIFDTSLRNIQKHVKNMIKSGEIDEKELTNKKFVRLYKSLNPDKKRTSPYLINQDHMMLLGFKIESNIGIEFRKWAVKVLNERINEEKNPELILNRYINTYKKKGYDIKWIEQRLKGIQHRNELVEKWSDSGIDGYQFAILTDFLTDGWAGMKTHPYKKYKGLKKSDSLRDHMNEIELTFNDLAEITNKKLIDQLNPNGYQENKSTTLTAADAVKKSKEAFEERIGQKIVSPTNNKGLAIA